MKKSGKPSSYLPPPTCPSPHPPPTLPSYLLHSLPANWPASPSTTAVGVKVGKVVATADGSQGGEEAPARTTSVTGGAAAAPAAPAGSAPPQPMAPKPHTPLQQLKQANEGRTARNPLLVAGRKAKAQAALKAQAAGGRAAAVGAGPQKERKAEGARR